MNDLDDRQPTDNRESEQAVGKACASRVAWLRQDKLAIGNESAVATTMADGGSCKLTGASHYLA
jgi:hypothetical protein